LRSPVWTNLDLAIYEISATSGLAEVVKIWSRINSQIAACSNFCILK
jgi:hypothetical protein